MPNILIVDDSPTIRRMVRAALGVVDAATFVEASSGLEAIELLALHDIHLMVLDLNMPDMHGLEVLGFVRAQKKFAPLPILVLTTRGDEPSRSAAVTAGATAFMTKPFAPGDLSSRARDLLHLPSATERR
jgi:two-component system chemotaxis response regulator CheY